MVLCIVDWTHEVPERFRTDTSGRIVEMPRISAGLLMFRRRPDGPQLLLVHPGGPFWRNKDDGAWSIPKGEVEADEDLLAAAKREFEEELGLKPMGQFVQLTPIRLKGGKIVHAWAFEGDCDPTAIKSNTFITEWPPRSGRQMEFPEVDRAEFFSVNEAKRKINPRQIGLIEEVSKLVGGDHLRHQERLSDAGGTSG